jgi:hypothetical protein
MWQGLAHYQVGGDHRRDQDTLQHEQQPGRPARIASLTTK